MSDFDFATLETAKEAVFLQLKHPSTFEGLELPDTEGAPADRRVGVFIVGVDSDEYQTLRRDLIDKNLQKMETTLKNTGKMKPQLNLSAKEQDERKIGQLVACIKGWQNIVYGGEQVEFTPANVEAYLRKYSWMREQVDEAVDDRGLFLPRSATT